MSFDVSDDEQTGNRTTLRPQAEAGGYEWGPILSVEEVSTDRFDWFPSVIDGVYHDFGLHDRSLIAPDLRGTHEVRHGWLIDGKVYDAYSRFFRKERDRWVLTSWTWHFNEICDALCEHFSPDCKYFIDIVPWDRWYEE